MRKNTTDLPAIAERAIDKLKQKYDPLFIVLYGSIPRGDWTISSDIDIACVCEAPDNNKISPSIEGVRLDVWFYSETELDATAPEFFRFLNGRLYFDEQGKGADFLRALNAEYLKGPTPITGSERLRLQSWVASMLERAQGTDVEANFRRTWLPCELLEIYFQWRGQWYLGSKQAFAWLKLNDLETYQLFEQSFRNPADLHALKKLSEAVLA